MMDTCVILQVVWIVGGFLGWGGGGGGEGRVKSFYYAKTMTRESGVSSLRKCSFNQNYTPNCHIEEMRGDSVFKIIPHCVT